jgi:hypothetical protein
MRQTLLSEDTAGHTNTTFRPYTVSRYGHTTRFFTIFHQQNAPASPIGDARGISRVLLAASSRSRQVPAPFAVCCANHCRRARPVQLRDESCAFIGGGGDRNRTDDPLLAKQVLSQLSYTPVQMTEIRYQKTELQPRHRRCAPGSRCRQF